MLGTLLKILIYSIFMKANKLRAHAKMFTYDNSVTRSTKVYFKSNSLYKLTQKMTVVWREMKASLFISPLAKTETPNNVPLFANSDNIFFFFVQVLEDNKQTLTILATSQLLNNSLNKIDTIIFCNVTL